MRVSDEGMDLIKQFEGLRQIAYRDAVGVWTIGYGHTSMAGEPAVTPGLKLTRQECAEILARDVATFSKGVAEQLRVPLNDAQFSALVAFAYNVGLGNLRKSSVLAAINAGDFAAVPRRLALWIKAGGRVLPGLVRRRAAEAALFMGQGTAVANQPIAHVEGKPMGRSKTVWSAAITAMLAGLQGFYLAHVNVWWALVAIVIIGAATLIITERFKKSKHEGL